MMRCAHQVLVALSVAAACSPPPGGVGTMRDAASDVVDAPWDSSVTDARAPDAAPDAGISFPVDASSLDAADAGPILLPDLTVDHDRARIDIAIEQRDFPPGACELDPVENCVGGPGMRTLLRFAVESPNIGTADLVLGPPVATNPNFVYSPCHNHFHYLGYAAYQLLDAGGTEVATGQKQAFCLLDTEKYITDDPTVAGSPRFYCGDQGIQRGWSDVYPANLPCQWIDVTDVPNGSYTLRVSLNTARTLPELDYTNNVIDVAVTLGDPSISTPTEACPAGMAARTTKGSHRECGWRNEGTWNCTPGATFRIGCAATCGLGSCTGDPIIRVCDNARADGNCSEPGAMATSDNTCSSVCPRVQNLTCPPSGKVDVYSAANTLGAAYTCNVAFEHQ